MQKYSKNYFNPSQIKFISDIFGGYREQLYNHVRNIDETDNKDKFTLIEVDFGEFCVQVSKTFEIGTDGLTTLNNFQISITYAFNEELKAYGVRLTNSLNMNYLDIKKGDTVFDESSRKCLKYLFDVCNFRFNKIDNTIFTINSKTFLDIGLIRKAIRKNKIRTLS